MGCLTLSLISACSVKLQTRPQIIFRGQAEIRARAEVRAQARAQVAVPVQGSAVVEFFGVPLEGAQDVVFVLDRSGSMAEPAQGAIANVAIADANTVDPSAVAPAGDPNAVDPSAVDPAVDPNAVDPNADQKGGQPQVMARTKFDVAHEELADALQRLPEGTRMNVIFFNDDLQGFAAAPFVLEASARSGLIGFVKDTVPLGSTALVPAMRTAFLMNARRVVLLSDGLGNIGGDSSDLLRDAREAMRGGVRIDTIGLGVDQDAALLSSLASESGGIYQDLR